MRGSWAAIAVCACLGTACAGKIPPTRYGIEELEVGGMEKLDDDSLEACLVLSARSHASLQVAPIAAGKCGQPPFDAFTKHADLWPWRFRAWPLFDRLAFEADQRRILRWFEARGYHHARIVGTSVVPGQAARRDTLDATTKDPGCERNGSGQGCSLRVHFIVQEGEPTLLAELVVMGLETWPEPKRRELLGGLPLRVGKRFDEAFYDDSIALLKRALAGLGYARAQVAGRALVDREQRTARVELRVDTGPPCVFGRVLVKGAQSFMEQTVREITLIDPGDPFDPEAIVSAQRAVFSSGAFATVQVEPVLPSSGREVDVLVTVTPARKHRYGVGFGIQSGVVTRGDTWDPVSIPQWDVHLVARYVQNGLFSGPRRLTLEDRPALIMQEPFPLATVPRFGNEFTAELRQFGLLEPRTALRAIITYVWGPDPYDTFFRHRIDTGVGLERLFLRAERLYLAAGIHNSIYRVPEDERTQDGEEPPASSLYTAFIQRLRLDYRDNPARPRKGAMLQAEVQEIGLSKLSSWRGFRTTPDGRVYVPLPLQASLALRFAVGMLFIRDADADLDELSRELGPRDTRLRGGGATSNRGWLPGELGDGPDGGTRRWESSFELRLRLSENFGMVGFFDAGDVSRKPQFRWDHPQASSGFGLRYETIVTAIRMDVAWRIARMQVYGEDERDPGGDQNEVNLGFTKFSGAIHITLGEAF